MVLTQLRLSNKQARWLWLETQGLSVQPTGPLDILQLIRDLGFVQLDTIQAISRSHHHILWSRNQNYREPMLDRALRARHLFEHFTHDASLLPMEFLPMWQRQFRRKAEYIANAGWWTNMPDAAGRAEIRDRIAREGPLSTHDFDTKIVGGKGMWKRPPHKLALDFMWYAGELATCHRKGFAKCYDLAERVFPDHLRRQHHRDETQIDWLCHAALDRLGVASQGEIQRFWGAMSAAEAKAWVSKADLVPVEIEGQDRTVTTAWAKPGIEAWLAQLSKPTSRLRILNPFDPAIRDRARIERLFGFEYRVEMFVPAAKRRWGYYVYPLLEGDRFVGRIEARADRSKGVLSMEKLWVEPGVRWTSARDDKLSAELTRIARLAGVGRVTRNQAPLIFST